MAALSSQSEKIKDPCLHWWFFYQRRREQRRRQSSFAATVLHAATFAGRTQSLATYHHHHQQQQHTQRQHPRVIWHERSHCQRFYHSEPPLCDESKTNSFSYSPRFPQRPDVCKKRASDQNHRCRCRWVILMTRDTQPDLLCWRCFVLLALPFWTGTGLWFLEAREVSRNIFIFSPSRCHQYPMGRLAFATARRFAFILASRAGTFKFRTEAVRFSKVTFEFILNRTVRTLSFSNLKSKATEVKTPQKLQVNDDDVHDAPDNLLQVCCTINISY